MFILFVAFQADFNLWLKTHPHSNEGKKEGKRGFGNNFQISLAEKVRTIIYFSNKSDLYNFVLKKSIYILGRFIVRSLEKSYGLLLIQINNDLFRDNFQVKSFN